MKTKELIEILNKEDPDGESEVVVGSSPILTAMKQPGFYDGCFWKVETDKGPFDLTSISLNSNSSKVVLWSEDIFELLFTAAEKNNMTDIEEILNLIKFDSPYSKNYFARFFEDGFRKEIEESFYSKKE